MSTDEITMKSQAKIDQWERKLLDLSLRNALINMKFNGAIIPVFAHSPALLEDKLFEDVDFNIKPRSSDEKKKEEPVEEEKSAEDENPAEEEKSVEEAAPEAEKKPEEEKAKKETIPVKEYDFENICDITGFEKLITDSFDDKKLYSSLTKSELEKNIKKLYRGAKVALEENGANTLYLSLGMMKWFETGSESPHYAPLILIPIDLVRKSIVLGYVIRRRDEDPIVNITLLEKLKQDFGIVANVSELLVTDDSGIDIDKTIANFRLIIEGQEKWDIYNSCVIGMFSFTNFVMWNDLHARRDKIGENKIVKSLLEGRLCWDAKSMVVPDKLEETGSFIPITADSSQLYAIKCASEGESFVLHGPPGTGKSQTITSMIADLLAHGKTVLFAAEKKAALDVVYSRLDKIGLGPFCLELHSNKAKKSAFLDKLKEAVEIRKKTGTGDYNKMMNDLANRRHELDGYCAALHDVRKCGYSLYELINIYTVNALAPDVPAFDEHFLDTVNADTYKECEAGLEAMLSAGKVMGDATKLQAVRTSEYSQKLKADLPNDAAALKTSVTTLENAFASARNTLSSAGITIPGTADSTFASIRRMKDISDRLISSFALPAKLCALDDYDAVFRDIEAYKNEKKNISDMESKLFEFYKPEILTLDLNGLNKELQEASSKSLFKSMAVGKVYKKLEPYRASAFKDENVADHIAQALSIVNAKSNCDRIFNERLASFVSRDVLDDDSKSTEFVSNAKSMFESLDNYDRTMNLRKVFASNSSYANVWNDLSNAYAAFDDSHDNLENSIGIRATHDTETVEDQYAMCDDLINNIEFLKDKVMLNQSLGGVRSKGLVNVVNAYLSGDVSEGDVIPAFRKAFTKLLITNIIDSDDNLRNFSGKVFEEKVEQFKKLNDEFMTITRQEIYLRVASSLPDLAVEAQKDSALGILQRAIKSGGRGVSIRTLFTKIPHLITKLCPCVLMSPISVAQYLEPGVLNFDTVIFDEASQLPTCKAVGVIARANNAIIVGDPNQMPPTSFFQSANYDEENYELEDLESILDDCLALSMPGTHLLWHYRSKHESLITYSNRAFYDNRLYTFPSSNDLERKVTFVKCEGSFDRGKTRTNTVEANKVVDEIVKRITEDPNRSIGVVTFNISQQNLIDDLVAERCRNNPELENALYGSEEPVFIKNLENVQGDERDVILFSVGYGMDEEGKVYMNFGPLSQDGGWRRLNVAVTRARYEMVVFSSLEPEQIRTTDDTARGVVAFRSFLEYAQGRSVWENSASPVSDSAPVVDRFKGYDGIVDGISDKLNEAGYKTTKMIGSSEYKIDIGVVDPDDENNYLLGILLDGKFYLENKTTSGREIYQQNVLKGLGWNTMRVWSVDWWENSQRVVDDIIAKITAIIADREAKKTMTEDVTVEEPAAPSEVVEDTEPAEPESVPEQETEAKKSNPQEAPAGENT